MFVGGSIVALGIVLITLRARSPTPGSCIVARRSVRDYNLLSNMRAFAYLLLVMTMMTCLSHGTQTSIRFLKTIPGSPKQPFRHESTYGSRCSTTFVQLSEH